MSLLDVSTYSHPKLECHSSIFREAVCGSKDGISASHTLKSETKLPFPATSLALPVSTQESSHQRGHSTRECSGDQRSGSISLLCTYSHIQWASCLVPGPDIWKMSSFAYFYLIVEEGTHQLCPPQMPWSSAVMRRRQKRPFSKPFA